MDMAISKGGWVSTVCATVLACAAALPVPARALSVWYEVDFFGANASGYWNGAPFSNANLQFDFFGDTSNVQAFSVPDTSSSGTTTGYFNPMGYSSSVSFNVWDANTYAQIASGNFDPSTGIMVTVDNTNGGIGFSCCGPVGSSSFAPVYPGAILVPDCCVSPNVDTYDLQSNFFVSAWQLSCYGFPGGCSTGPALLTIDGNQLVLNQVTVAQGQFYAQVFQWSSVSMMSSFNASVTTSTSTSGTAGVSNPNRFRVQGTFVLGAGAEQVDPAAQEVVLSLGQHRFVIPAGAFKGSKDKGFAFRGRSGGAALHATLTPQGSNRYAFQVEGAGAPALSDTLAVRMTVANFIGRTHAKAVRE